MHEAERVTVDHAKINASEHNIFSEHSNYFPITSIIMLVA